MMSLRNMVRGMENDAAAGQLIQYWEHDAGTLRFWRAGSNFVYRFEREGIPQYLRFIHEEDNTEENIRAELDVVLILIGKGYPAASPVRSKNGNRIETIHTADGRYHGVVFEQAKGIRLPLDQMTDRHAEEWGRSLASLHRLSEAYSCSDASTASPRRSWSDALAFAASVLKRHPREHGARRGFNKSLYSAPCRTPSIGGLPGALV